MLLFGAPLVSGLRLYYNLVPRCPGSMPIKTLFVLPCAIFFILILIIYFWLHWVFVAARGLSLVAASRGYSSLRGLLIAVASRCRAWVLGTWASVVVTHGLSSCGLWALERRLTYCGAQASHCGGFSYCGARALGVGASVVVARGLSSCGSWALERRLSSCGARA